MNTSDFWKFSVQHYAKSGVADSCLVLQDEFGLDVNLVLFCIWYGQNFGKLSQPQLERAIKFSSLWTANVVKPLRQTRRWIKQHKEETGIPAEVLGQFREKVKQLELEAEQLQQDHLQQLLTLGSEDLRSGSSGAVSKNLDSYLQTMGIQKNESIVHHLAKITSER